MSWQELMDTMPLGRHRPLSPEASARWRRVDLEMSLKAFARGGRSSYEDTARRVLRSWERLIDRADEVAGLLWVGDGTEMMIWSGDPEQPLEWARYEGFCNLNRKAEPYFPGWFENRPPVVFADGLERMTYDDLRQIIAALKRGCRELYGMAFHAGMTFDPSPEFVESPFKYDEHLELLSDHPEGARRYAQRMVSHQAVLHSDPRPFAGFPNGVREGTTLGSFLGAQARGFAEDLGFDYLWLSNGFGYSHYAWHINGDVLETDGSWRVDRVPRQLELLRRFWTDFKRACPELPLEFRGTNQTVGTDLATDAASHRIVSAVTGSDVGPPNIPVLKAELLAMDITAYLTRMAGAPSRRLIYRAYLNDPWHEHNPWQDIYHGEPFETLSCMSCSRLRADGSLDTPTDLHILTIDNERGEMPQDPINEAVPGYLQALEQRADAAGPVVWVYPFNDFHRVLDEAPERLPHVFACDHHAWRSIESGLPMNTVIEADAFAELASSGPIDALQDRVWVAPTPLIKTAYEPALMEHIKHGGQVMLYGTLDFAAPELLEMLGIERTEDGLTGDFRADRTISCDRFDADAGDTPLPLRHYAGTAGGIREQARDGVEPWLTIEQGGRRRAWAVVRRDASWHGGQVAWVRGTVPFDSVFEPPYTRPKLDDFQTVQRPHDAMRHLLDTFGYRFVQQRSDANADTVRVFIKRHRGAWFFVGSKPDTTARLMCRTPDGAPLFTGLDTVVRDGLAVDSFSKTLNHEVRFFVQAQNGKYRAATESFGLHQSAAYSAHGFHHDTVVCYPDPDALRDGRVLVLARHLDDKRPDGSPVAQLPHRVEGDRIVIEDHSGSVFLKW
ncbi:MAG: hypothetical protein AAGI68_12755 [Planctomycetota bacterium]